MVVDVCGYLETFYVVARSVREELSVNYVFFGREGNGWVVTARDEYFDLFFGNGRLHVFLKRRPQLTT
jgi:hypothetical protein